ncbi:MAG: DUF177 domain-containing protein [Tannerella sp.]|nr:DUF177 domain-containing protein [Tannerella sp.]
MGKFDAYQINLKTIALGEVKEYEFLLENKFFIDIDGPEVQKGKVTVSLRLEHKTSGFVMNFHTTGTVIVPCDRCLDDIEIPVETDNRLIIKLGKEYAEESDEILVISEDEGAINLAWFLYEFVALAIPMKRVHMPGKCNKGMSSKLRKHATKQPSDDEEDMGDFEEDDIPVSDDLDVTDTDPRWDALKDIM